MTEAKKSILSADGFEELTASETNISLSPLEAFVDALPPGSERLLLISPRLDLDLERLKHRRFHPSNLEARVSDPLLRLNLQSLHPDVRIAPFTPQAPSLPQSLYRGIYLHELFATLDPPACLAWVSQSAQALLPQGALWVSCPEAQGRSQLQGPRKAYTKADLSSLLRQSGFQILQVGRGPGGESGEKLLALLARRL
jgi:hypothetical protein